MRNRCLWAISFIVLLTGSIVISDPAPAPGYLKRSLSQVAEKPDDLTTAKAHFKPLFGIGDDDAQAVKGIARFGILTVDPDGATRTVRYDREERACFVVKGSGVLLYGEEKVPIRQNDFAYLAPGVKHAFLSESTGELCVIAMGYFVPEGKQVSQMPKPMLASADDVGLQVLGQHGPTTQFKLLMGNTRSLRDKLAAAQQINSLFMMDFAPGGTNIPHTHPVEEEIYYMLRGNGEMVAGGTTDNEVRYSCKEGDAFYFAPKTLIGYYSAAREGQPHDLILAVRSPYPAR